MKKTAMLQIVFVILVLATSEIQGQPDITGFYPGGGEEYAGLRDAMGIIPGWKYAGIPEIKSLEEESGYRNFFKTDSAFVYRWDSAVSDWQLYQVQYYIYTSGRLTELLTKDYQTGTEAALSVYTYNSTGRNESSTNYIWAGEWKAVNRYLNEYDQLGRTASIRYQRWVNDAWTEDRLQHNYLFDTQNRVTRFETIYWRNNAWTLPSVNEHWYNDLGQLESRVASRPGGAIDYRIIYNYSDRGLMTQFYTQYPAGAGWSNWNLRTLEYDACGMKWSQTQYAGEGPNWTPSTRHEFFTSFRFDLYTGGKLPVCHKGKTLWIGINGIQAHLDHGDCIGECLYEKKDPKQSYHQIPFTVYPNPARERFTVRFDEDCLCSQARIELCDFSGTLIKSFPVNDNSPIVVERNNLKSGNYFVRFISDEVYSISVIFK